MAIEAMHQAFIDQLKSKGVLSTPAIEAAFRAVPRHMFLPGVAAETVYQDDAVVTKRVHEAPVSSSSQPSLMAGMLEQLQLEPGQRVLEIGAGTGYNAALMAHIVGSSGQVVTIDIDEDIVEDARAHLAVADFDNVQVICADGGLGYAGAAPYDRIILTVNAGDITPAWWTQLKADGRLLLPLSLRSQQLVVVFERAVDHLVSLATICGYFVGLRGAFAEPGSFVQLNPEWGLVSLTLAEPRSIQAKTIYQLLAGPGREMTTGLQATSRQIFDGLNPWLALHDPHFCILIGHGPAIEQGIIPNIFNYSSGSELPIAPALLNETSLSVLTAVNSSRPEDGAGDAPTFELRTSSFGPDEALAQRLLQQIRAWDAAGRPGQRNLRIKAYPHDVAYAPSANEIIIPKRWTTFVVSWNF